MVMLVDIEPADLTQKPVIRQRLRPCGIDHKTRRLAGARRIVHARFFEQAVKRSIVLQDIDIGLGGEEVVAGEAELGGTTRNQHDSSCRA